MKQGAQATAQAFIDLQSNLTAFAATFQTFAQKQKAADDVEIAQLDTDIKSLMTMISE